MSQHPSLRVDSVGIKHRNVLKRYEKLKKLVAQGKWADDSSVYKIPKIKSIKVKVKAGGGRRDEKEEENKK